MGKSAKGDIVKEMLEKSQKEMSDGTGKIHAERGLKKKLNHGDCALS